MAKTLIACPARDDGRARADLLTTDHSRTGHSALPATAFNVPVV